MKFFTSITTVVSLLLLKDIKVYGKPTLDTNLDYSFEMDDKVDLSTENVLAQNQTYNSLNTSFNPVMKRDELSNGNFQSINDISYVESLSEVQNPYRGFYSQAVVYLRRNGKSEKHSIPKTNLIRLLVDISDYQKHSIDEEALTFLDKYLEQIKRNHKTIVIRFAYDPGFKGDVSKDPSSDNVRNHQKQVSRVLKKYDDIIASVECGLFGKWGEMHGSSVYSDSEKPKYLNKVINNWLEFLPESLTISVRTPKIYSDWANIDLSKISNQITKPNEKAYRVGIYNDGYLASKSDLGTYKNREQEIKWLKNQAKHTLFGGEFGGIDEDDDMGNVSPTADYMDKEAFLTHTSYLNNGHYNVTISNLKNKKYNGVDKRYKGISGYNYVENHLGYRYVVRGVRLTKSAKSNGIFRMEVDIENVGYGNLVKPKSLSLLVIDNNNNRYDLSEIQSIENGNPNNWNSKEKTTVKVKAILPNGMKNGNYKVYLRIATGTKSKGLNGFPIRFANDDKNIWNESLGANYIGKFSINGTSNNNNDESEPTISNYVTIKFKGTLDPTLNYYLGVKELKNYEYFDIHDENSNNSYKYRTWHVTSETKPSLLYLSDGTYGNPGNPSSHCLDLGNHHSTNGYNFLSIVNCENAKHKFMYGGYSSDSIDVYDINGKHLTDSNNNKLCVYYSMTPRIDKCNNDSGKMKWKKSIL